MRGNLMEIRIIEEIKKEIPPLTDEELHLLEASIVKDGIRDPLVIWNRDDENVLVDGHNRYNIAKRINCNFTTVAKEFASMIDAKIWIRKNQLGRRNLTDGWKAELALRNKDDLMKKGREKQKETLKQYKTEDTVLSETDRTDRTEKLFSETKKEPELKQYKTEDTVSTETVETVEEKQPEKHDTREEVAKELGWSSGKVAQAEYVKKNNPDNWEKAKSGDYSINKAYEETKKVEKKKEKKEELIQKKKEYEERINDDVFEEKEYRIIYADPPWKYNDKQDTPNLGGANKHYDTMSIPELCDMKISEITEKDAVLFLWTTSPFLEDSFKIINSWGFKYKSSFVWDKVMHNMGHYNSVRHEFLLIATKGSCTPDEKKLFDSVQSIEKTRKHSEKPEKFREIIDTLYVYGNRIELFARKKHDHWDVYGNEVADEQ